MTQSIGYRTEVADRRPPGVTPLTKREWEVLWMISKGHDNKGIAELLGIRLQTVKNHTSNVLSKMQARNRTHAAMMAIRKGWLDFPTEGPEETGPTIAGIRDIAEPPARISGEQPVPTVSNINGRFPAR